MAFQKNNYFWSGIGQFGSQILGFIGNILVARILMPDDYGLISMVAIFIGLALTFTDSGFADCLIRKPDASTVDFGTVATFNIVIALLIYIIIFLIAPLVARFFGRSELIWITRIISISFVIKSLTITRITWLRRNLKFKKIALMNLQSSVISIFLTYYLALKGFGYWTLALQPIFISLSNFLYLTISTKWIPFFKFNYNSFKEMFGYSLNLLISFIINQVGQNLYSILIGKFYSVTYLGFFNQAKRMYEVPTYGINTVVLSTSYPVIAQELDDNKKRLMYTNLLRNYITIHLFIVLILIGVAEPVWNFLLGEKWLSSIPYFKLFMMISLVTPLVTVNSNIAKIHNRSSIYRNLALLRNGLSILGLVICVGKSLNVILYGQIVAAYLSVIFDMLMCGKIIDFNFWKQFRIFILAFSKPAVAYIFSKIICNVVDGSIYINGIVFLLTFVSSVFVIYIMTKDIVFVQFIYNLKKKF